MSLGDQIYEAFLAEKVGGLKWPRQRLAIVQKFASPAVLDAAGFGPEVQPGRNLSNRRIFESFVAVERDRDALEDPDGMRERRHTFPAWVCDQAAEILFALGQLEPPRSPKTRTADASAAFGRVCAYCWRTEARPRKVGLYGRCHVHIEIPAPQPGESEAEEQREVRLAARSEADKARRLIAAAPPGSLERSNYPVLPRRPQVPNLSETNWREFVETSFPLSAAFVLEGSKDALLTFVDTVAALEGRPLTQNEIGELTEPDWALPPLLRCEAWLGLKETLFSRRGKVS